MEAAARRFSLVIDSEPVPGAEAKYLATAVNSATYSCPPPARPGERRPNETSVGSGTARRRGGRTDSLAHPVPPGQTDGRPPAVYSAPPVLRHCPGLIVCCRADLAPPDRLKVSADRHAQPAPNLATLMFY